MWDTLKEVAIYSVQASIAGTIVIVLAVGVFFLAKAWWWLLIFHVAYSKSMLVLFILATTIAVGWATDNLLSRL